METNNTLNSRGDNVEDAHMRNDVMEATKGKIGDSERGSIFNQVVSSHSGGLRGSRGHQIHNERTPFASNCTEAVAQKLCN